MNTQTAGYQNKLLGAVAQTDYTGGFVCLWRRLESKDHMEYLGAIIEKNLSRKFNIDTTPTKPVFNPNLRNLYGLKLLGSVSENSK